jgi:hypothetical protein
MADPGIPPEHRPYVAERRMVPKPIRKEINKGLKSHTTQRAQKYLDKADAMMADAAAKGVVLSEMNKPVYHRIDDSAWPKLSEEDRKMERGGRKTRRGKKGAGWKDTVMSLGKSAAKSVASDLDKKDSEAQAQQELDASKKALGNTVSQLRELSQMVGPIGGRTTRRAATSGGDIVCHLLTIRNQVKLYHWQTGSFARHKATDDLTAALDTSIDAFVESYMGRYGRPKVSGGIKLHNFSEAAAKKFVAKETKYLETELPRKIGKADTDLLNLRDTILGDLTKVSYLFTLN